MEGTKGRSKLNGLQGEVVEECIRRGGGGLSLTMGSGKTLIGLVLAQSFEGGNGRAIVIVSKSIVDSWMYEIKKFFGETLSYVVFHGNKVKKMGEFELKGEKIVITTPETLSKYFREYNVDEKFTEKQIMNLGRFNQHVKNVYKRVKSPLTKSTTRSLASALYSEEWSSVIIDEAHNHTNVMTVKCRAIAALCSRHKWAMSGTLFNEPKIERILGYHLMIDDKDFPRSLPDAEKHVRSSRFKGITKTMVYRKANKV